MRHALRMLLPFYSELRTGGCRFKRLVGLLAFKPARTGRNAGGFQTRGISQLIVTLTGALGRGANSRRMTEGLVSALCKWLRLPRAVFGVIQPKNEYGAVGSDTVLQAFHAFGKQQAEECRAPFRAALRFQNARQKATASSRGLLPVSAVSYKTIHAESTCCGLSKDQPRVLSKRPRPRQNMGVLSKIGKAPKSRTTLS